MLNSTHIQQKILNNPQLLGITYTSEPVQKGQSKSKKQTKFSSKKKTTYKTPEKTVEGMYLSILSRYPTAKEKQTALAYFDKSGLSRRDAGVDVVWALLNTKEFIYRH